MQYAVKYILKAIDKCTRETHSSPRRLIVNPDIMRKLRLAAPAGMFRLVTANLETFSGIPIVENVKQIGLGSLIPFLRHGKCIIAYPQPFTSTQLGSSESAINSVASRQQSATRVNNRATLAALIPLCSLFVVCCGMFED